MKAYFRQHPLVFTIFVLGSSRLAGFGIIQIILIANPNLSLKEDLGWALQLLYMLMAFLLVYGFGQQKDAGISLPPDKKEWLFWIPPLVFPIFIIFSFGVEAPASTWRLVMLLLAAFGVAANEELIFRGLFLKSFLHKGIYPAIFIPALIFGLIHLPNVFFGTDLSFAIFQTCWAFLGGIALGAMRLRNQSILPVIVFHFLVDSMEYLSTGEIGIHITHFSYPILISFIGLNLLFMSYAFILLNRKQNIRRGVLNGRYQTN
ncbi:CPBP family intramembrane glutamic endopeptidase [Neobacillus muris]|uniref:CPBP family intramembrane glutamic endopeptidase n=1 Tax=Neobacillus muris TaxID=2941334 RepID=UPI00203BDBD4|nr:type II CAAX endopeptidase family protein [Neobacillus muris]